MCLEPLRAPRRPFAPLPSKAARARPSKRSRDVPELLMDLLGFAEATLRAAGATVEHGVGTTKQVLFTPRRLGDLGGQAYSKVWLDGSPKTLV